MTTRQWSRLKLNRLTRKQSQTTTTSLRKLLCFLDLLKFANLELRFYSVNHLQLHSIQLYCSVCSSRLRNSLLFPMYFFLLVHLLIATNRLASQISVLIVCGGGMKWKMDEF